MKVETLFTDKVPVMKSGTSTLLTDVYLFGKVKTIKPCRGKEVPD